MRNLPQLFVLCKYCQSNNWWRFRKNLWPSQNIWTLSFNKKKVGIFESFDPIVSFQLSNHSKEKKNLHSHFFLSFFTSLKLKAKSIFSLLFLTYLLTGIKNISFGRESKLTLCMKVEHQWCYIIDKGGKTWESFIF